MASSADTPQGRGYAFERDFGDALGIEPTKGSGNQWYAPMDLGDAHILVSCKHTDKNSFSVGRDHLREVRLACRGDQEPALAVSVAGEVYVIQRAGDWLAGRTKEPTIEPRKDDVKRASARVPGLLRDDA